MLTTKIIGAVTDVDYSSSIYDCPGNCVKTLRHLSAVKLVSDYSLLSRYCCSTPNIIKQILMSVALDHSRHIGIQVLLTCWPYNYFYLTLPPDLKTWRLFYLCNEYDRFNTDIMRFLNCTWTVSEYFMSSIKHSILTNAEIPIYYLDLSEIPTNDECVQYICTNVRNIKKAITKLKQSSLEINYGNVDEHVGNNNSLTQGKKYTLKLHCTVNNKDTVRLLISALDICGESSFPINLIISGLRITADGYCNGIVKLLESLNPKDIEIFCTEFRISSYSTCEMLFSVLRSFHNLKALDLSYCFVEHLRLNLGAFQMLGQLLQKLVHLNRLDLSNCRILGCVEGILGNLYSSESNDGHDEESSHSLSNKKMKTTSCAYEDCNKNYGKLMYLSLAGCCLLPSDVTYLKNAPYMKNLLNLNLSDNTFQLYWFVQLLAAVKDNLRVLEIENCRFDVDIGPLFTTLATMKKLTYLNLAGLILNPEYMITKIPEISQMTSLQCLRMSYRPIPLLANSHNDTLSDIFEVRKAFSKKIQKAFENLRGTFSSLKIIFR